MSDNVQKICQRFLKNKTSMSWLVIGGKGLGKKELVYEIAKVLLGEEGISSGFKFLECGLTDEAKKRIQKDILDGKLVDVSENENKKNEITVEDIRSAINFLSLKTTFPCKILVISLAEQMNVNAQNALLKTLEEPFEKTLIFLLSENPSKLLPTILSRCQKIHLRPMGKETLIRYIQNKYPQEKNTKLIAEISEGLPGIADEICNYNGIALYTRLNSFFVPISKLNIANLLIFAQETTKDIHQYQLVMLFILKFLNNQAMIQPISIGQKYTKLYFYVESIMRKTDSLYLDKAQVLSDILLKIAEQFK